MKTIWKYEIKADDVTQLALPLGAEPLSVQEQRGNAYLWVKVDPNQRVHETRTFRLVGTGHPFDDSGMKFLGTFQLTGGSLVFHLFEVV
jgi:hypothetical protein